MLLRTVCRQWKHSKLTATLVADCASAILCSRFTYPSQSLQLHGSVFGTRLFASASSHSLEKKSPFSPQLRGSQVSGRSYRRGDGLPIVYHEVLCEALLSRRTGLQRPSTYHEVQCRLTAHLSCQKAIDFLWYTSPQLVIYAMLNF